MLCPRSPSFTGIGPKTQRSVPIRPCCLDNGSCTELSVTPGTKIYPQISRGYIATTSLSAANKKGDTDAVTCAHFHNLFTDFSAMQQGLVVQEGNIYFQGRDARPSTSQVTTASRSLYSSREVSGTVSATELDSRRLSRDCNSLSTNENTGVSPMWRPSCSLILES